MIKDAYIMRGGGAQIRLSNPRLTSRRTSHVVHAYVEPTDLAVLCVTLPSYTCGHLGGAPSVALGQTTREEEPLVG